MDIFTSWGSADVWPRERILASPQAGSLEAGGGVTQAAPASVSGADASGPTQAATTGAPVTLLVTREKAEHANLFHATSDFLNAFFM